MNKTARAMALALTAALTISPSLAEDVSPVGKWLSGTGESSYQITMCGDGSQLCAELVWLREDAQTKANLPYMNTYLVKEAEKVSVNRWKGKVHVYGQTLNGTITLASATEIDLRGCLFIFCKSFKLNKVED